jgi:hypothetical protein
MSRSVAEAASPAAAHAGLDRVYFVGVGAPQSSVASVCKGCRSAAVDGVDSQLMVQVRLPQVRLFCAGGETHSWRPRGCRVVFITYCRHCGVEVYMETDGRMDGWQSSCQVVNNKVADCRS